MQFELKFNYEYSNEIVYNNFSFPSEISDKLKEQIKTLADLYKPLPMPPKLLKAHETLDKAVDKLYSKTLFKTDTERVAHLFELNKKLTSLIVEDSKKSKKVKK
ncbi:MAG: hypothetical protein NTZ60_08075 [Campylobacterales bacterium]|nr:hypothetical protein [Campylobacterales bacterium]